MPRYPRYNLVILLLIGSIAALLPAGSTAQDDKKPASAAVDADWKKLFDGKTLTGWKKADFFRSGNVEVKDGAILMEKGSMMTGVTYDRADFPKMNYEVQLEGKKLAGNDFFCTTTFPVGNSFCSLVVGGWGGRLTGISSINGADASENETTSNKEFKTGQWYRVRIRVTPKRLEAWIDTDKLVDLETEGLQLSVRTECSVCRPFGVATYDTTGAVRDIRVRPLTEAEQKSAPKKDADKDGR